MRVLITGATGFCGRWLCRLAADKGAVVFGMARRPGEDDRVEYLAADITNGSETADVLRESRPDIVIHLAAALPQDGSLDAEAMVHTNVLGTFNLLECAAITLSPAPRLVLASSSGIYGQPAAEGALIDEATARRPLSLYATTKVTQELLVEQYHLTSRLPTLTARAFNITGPGEPASLVCGSFARQIVRMERAKQAPVLRARTLESSRDFTDVRDVAAAYWGLAERGAVGRTYNVCSGQAVEIGAVARMLAELSERDDIQIIDESAQGSLRISSQRGDSSRLRRVTGWRPQFELATSLGDLLSSWRRRSS